MSKELYVNTLMRRNTKIFAQFVELFAKFVRSNWISIVCANEKPHEHDKIQKVSSSKFIETLADTIHSLRCFGSRKILWSETITSIGICNHILQQMKKDSTISSRKWERKGIFGSTEAMEYHVLQRNFFICSCSKWWTEKIYGNLNSINCYGYLNSDYIRILPSSIHFQTTLFHGLHIYRNILQANLYQLF